MLEDPLELGLAEGVEEAADDDAVVVVGSVAEDLVELLQPLRANPANIKVNNDVFFIGGLSCAPTDPAHLRRFAPHHGSCCSLTNDVRTWA